MEAKMEAKVEVKIKIKQTAVSWVLFPLFSGMQNPFTALKRGFSQYPSLEAVLKAKSEGHMGIISYNFSCVPDYQTYF